MNHLRPRRPSPALVISMIALVVSLGGTSYAAFHLGKNSVGTKQLKNGAVTTKKLADGGVTGAKVKLSTLGTVPKANHANTAGGAPPTGTASGALTGSYPNPGLAAAEPVRTVGNSGQPAFGSGWTDFGGAFQAAGFYKDRFGIVHLQGDVRRVSGSSFTIFVLPTGYCPTATENFPAYGNGGTAAAVAVQANCTVGYIAGDTGFLGLGGITFRAG